MRARIVPDYTFTSVCYNSRPMTRDTPIDVGALLAQLRTEVRAARGLLDDSSAHSALAGIDEDELRAAIAEVEALRAVSAHWPLTWQTPRQRVEVFAQRLIRRGLRWYVEPIVQQQNAYNNAVARALQLLADGYRQLATEVAKLESTSVQPENDPRRHTETHEE